MALVYNPATGQLEDNGLGPQGRPAAAPVMAAPTPFVGAPTQGGVGLLGLPPTTFLPDEAGPRGGGGGITVPAPSSLIPKFDFSPGAPGMAPAPVAPAVPAPAAATVPDNGQPTAGLQGSPARSAADLAGVNQGIAGALAAAKPQGGLTPVVGNQYNAQNTAAGTGAPGTAGLNFGFGVNGAPTATQVLANYAAQDRQGRLDQQVQADRLNQASLVSHLNDPFTSTQEKKVLLKQIELGATGLGQSAGLATAAAGKALDATTSAKTAEAQLENQRLIAQERNQTALEAAKLTGGYGLQAAGLRAEATKATAASRAGSNRLANAQADLAETQLNAARAAQEAGQVDPTGLVGLVKTGQVPIPKVPLDPLTGIPLTPQIIDYGQQGLLQQYKKQVQPK